MSGARHRRRSSWRRWSRWSNLLTVVLVAAWWLMLGPTAVGGPASYIAVQGHSMDGTYATGDLIVLQERNTYQVGDIVAFRAAGGQVIHRIIGGNGTDGYVMQGDNNPDIDPWHPTDEDVLGVAIIRLAGSAHYLDLPSEPWFAGLTAGLLTLLFLVPEGLKDRARRQSGADAPVTTPVLVPSMPAQATSHRRSPADLPRMRDDQHDRASQERR